MLRITSVCKLLLLEKMSCGSWGTYSYRLYHLISHNCGKPRSVVDKNVKHGRLRRTIVMKKISRQPEAIVFPLVVEMLGL